MLRERREQGENAENVAVSGDDIAQPRLHDEGRE